MDTDFLIVGAGPVGLTAALWLSRFGHDVMVVDAKSHGTDRSKALAIHAPTLEMLCRLGVAGPFLDEGIRIRATRVSNTEKELARLTFENVDSPHKFVLALPQARTEAILRDALAERGVDVRWGQSLSGFEQDAAGCVTSFDNGEECTSRWIIAADGAWSTVRQQLDIAFDGEDESTWFVLADVRIDWAEPEFRVFFCDDGFLLFMPMSSDMHRIVATLPKHGPGAPEPTEDLIRALVDNRTASPPTIAHFGMRSAFQVRRRLAERYRAGRTLLVGDAAHTHSPLAGQGMNIGMADAANLAWKLDLVERDLADPALLDTYEIERRSAATEVLATTSVGSPLGTSNAQLVDALKRVSTSTFDFGRYEIRNRVTSHAVRYASPIVAIDAAASADAADAFEDFQFRHGPRPGERAPDLFIGEDVTLLGGIDPTRHTLLFFDGEEDGSRRYERSMRAMASLDDLYPGRIECVLVTTRAHLATTMNTVRVDAQGLAHARYGAISEAAYLVRPDGFVAWRSRPANLEQLSDFLIAAYGW